MDQNSLSQKRLEYIREFYSPLSLSSVPNQNQQTKWSITLSHMKEMAIDIRQERFWKMKCARILAEVS